MGGTVISAIRNAFFRPTVAVRYITLGNVSTILYSQMVSYLAEDDARLFSPGQASAALLEQVNGGHFCFVGVRIEDLDELAERWERMGMDTWRTIG